MGTSCSSHAPARVDPASRVAPGAPASQRSGDGTQPSSTTVVQSLHGPIGGDAASAVASTSKARQRNRASIESVSTRGPLGSLASCNASEGSMHSSGGSRCAAVSSVSSPPHIRPAGLASGAANGVSGAAGHGGSILPNSLASTPDVLKDSIPRGDSVQQMQAQWEEVVMSGDVDSMLVHGGGLKGLKLRNDMRDSVDSDYSGDELEGSSNHMRAWLEEEDDDEDLAELRRQYSNTILLDESINDLLVRTNAVHGLKLRAEPVAESSDEDSDEDCVMEDWLDADDDEVEDFGTAGEDGPEELAVTVSELVEQSDWTHQDALGAVFAKAGLDREHQKRIIDALQSAEYKQGDFIVRQGDMGDKFFIIEEGEVVITRQHAEGESPEVVTHLYQGHFFGETSLRCREPRNANVQAIRGPVKVMFLTKERFDPLVDDDEYFRNMIDELVATKRETTRKREMLAQSGRQPVRPEYKSKEVKISKLTRSGVTKDRKQVINDYVIIKKLGKGAFGVVYLTFCLSNAALNAMKVVDLKLLRRRVLNLSDEEILKEAAVMKRLQHENLVGLFEVISDLVNDKLYLIQELVRGGAAMEDQEVNDPLDVSDVKKYFRDVLQGVHYLHYQGVAHRDLKPGNIMITDDGRAKIGDFGSAAILNVRPDGTVDDTLTEVRGTPAFLAPELYREQGERKAYSGFAVDVWALGVTLYNLVTGVPPFLANTEVAMAEKILHEEPPVSPTIEAIPHLRHLLRRMLDKEPAQRITVVEALKHPWLTDEGTDPIPIQTYERVNLKAEKLTFTTNRQGDEAGVHVAPSHTGSLMEIVSRKDSRRSSGAGAASASGVDAAIASGAGLGAGAGSLSPRVEDNAPTTSNQDEDDAGTGESGASALDGARAAARHAMPNMPPPLQPRASITEGIGVDDNGRPVNLGADIIPVNSSFDADGAVSPLPSPKQARRYPSDNSFPRCATVDVGLLASSAGGSRRTASSGNFRTAASMSIARGRSLEEACNTQYAQGVNHVRNLRQLQKQILDNSTLTDTEKDVMLDRVRSETWFAVNPASSRIALEMLSPMPVQKSATAAARRASDTNPVFTIEEGEGSDTESRSSPAPGSSAYGFAPGSGANSGAAAAVTPSKAVNQARPTTTGSVDAAPITVCTSTPTAAADSGNTRGLVQLGSQRIDDVQLVGSSMSLASNMLTPRMPNTGAGGAGAGGMRASTGTMGRMSLRRQPDFVMVSAKNEQHGIVMRPHMNTFSVTGGARRSQLEMKLPSGDGEDSSSDDEDFSDMEEADDLDEVFDPLSAPLGEDEDMVDLTPEEDRAFVEMRCSIQGGTVNPALNLTAAKAEAQGSLSVMEDRCVLLPNYSADCGIDSQCALMAVFDGHSGTATSQLLADTLPKRLAQDPAALVAHPKAHMGKVFAEVDRELVEFAETKGCTKSGATANVLFVRGETEECNVRTIFCANVGDSRCVLSRGGKALAMSIDHKPSRSDEAERIALAGGWVAKGRLHGVLAVSRAFGDVEHKGKLKHRFQPDVDFRGDPLIADPEVAVEQLLPDDEFAIIACDGLWDVVASQQAVNYVRRELTRTRDVQKAADGLVAKAIDNHTIDNVTVVVVCFQQNTSAHATST